MTDYPVLTPAHMPDARLYANRVDMVAQLKARLPERPTVCEVGVALGEFSQVLIDQLQPSKFYAMDLFQLHHETVLWGTPTKDIFGAGSHGQYYRRRFEGKNVEVMEGLSEESLGRLPDASLDLIYIDAAHDYQGVKGDAEQALKKIKPTGVLIFNDYLMFDHIQMAPYGVVQAVNELVAGSDWRVIGFALQHQMFCDIALAKGGR